MSKRKRHNHQIKITWLLNTSRLKPPQPGQVKIIDVYHDDCCALWSGGLCDCDPEIADRPADNAYSHNGRSFPLSDYEN